MSEKVYKSYQPGVCPVCEAEGQLKYSALKVQDNEVFFPFGCTSCGAEGKEWYILEFDESEVIKDE